MRLFPSSLTAAIICAGLLISSAVVQTATIIQANEAAAHVGEYATVEGVVAKVFTSNKGNTFLNIGAAYPNQTFTGSIPPASPVSKSAVLSDNEGKHVKITGSGQPQLVTFWSALCFTRIYAPESNVKFSH